MAPWDKAKVLATVDINLTKLKWKCRLCKRSFCLDRRAHGRIVEHLTGFQYEKKKIMALCQNVNAQLIQQYLVVFSLAVPQGLPGPSVAPQAFFGGGQLQFEANAANLQHAPAHFGAGAGQLPLEANAENLEQAPAHFGGGQLQFEANAANLQQAPAHFGAGAGQLQFEANAANLQHAPAHFGAGAGAGQLPLEANVGNLQQAPAHFGAGSGQLPFEADVGNLQQLPAHFEQATQEWSSDVLFSMGMFGPQLDPLSSLQQTMQGIIMNNKVRVDSFKSNWDKLLTEIWMVNAAVANNGSLSPEKMAELNELIQAVSESLGL